jgi:hypothetical protein|uniref:Uncharacterized protein n=1 Tax=Bacteriophage sp. TaxID=38018 RepID=A0A7G9A4U4_9VIRU|nr:MAG: hypothetical protein [Bacteriophage sp.]
MEKSQLCTNSLSLGVKMGNTLSYVVFCNYCGFEIQECLDIKSIELLKNIIQETIKANPIKKYTQANWKNWIKTSRLIIPGFNGVWGKLNKIRQNYFRKTIQEIWQKANSYNPEYTEYTEYIDTVLHKISFFWHEYNERIEKEFGKADFDALYNKRLYLEVGFDNFWEELAC